MSPHQYALSLSGYAAAADTEQAALRRRRLSEAVTKTILGGPSARGLQQQTLQLVVDQAKAVCTRYLKEKLRSSCGGRAAQKRLCLQRLKSLTTELKSPSQEGTNEVAQELCEIGLEIERSHPELFGSVVENVGLRCLPQPECLRTLFRSLAAELFRDDITWGRVVALYALSGALALDCVKHGHPERVLGLVNDVAFCVEKENVASFILEEGGWGALLSRFRKKCEEHPPQLMTSILFVAILVASAGFLLKVIFR